MYENLRRDYEATEYFEYKFQERDSETHQDDIVLLMLILFL